MLTKILFTAIVVTLVLLLFGKNRTPKVKKNPSSPPSKAFEQTLYLFLGICLAVSCTLYFLNWRDAHSTLLITVSSPHSSESKSYEVLKDDLNKRSFTTLDGQIISLSSSEHMEVRKKN